MTFRLATEYRPGIVSAILMGCYADLLDGALRGNLEQFDREVFTYPDTVGACSFISTLDDEALGFFSYDPRPGPEIGIIGHNGVLPAFQGRGYGTRQIQEILRLLTRRRFARVRVSTSEHPFFLPARRMYEKCGFRELGRTPGVSGGGYGVVTYEKPLTQKF